MGQSKPGKFGSIDGNCPICSDHSDFAFRPFCSRRCADVDLSRWLRGGYAIPVLDDEDEDGVSASTANDPGQRQDPSLADDSADQSDKPDRN